MLDRDGATDRMKARELPTEAIALYHHLGMPKHVEMVERMRTEVYQPQALVVLKSPSHGGSRRTRLAATAEWPSSCVGVEGD